MCKFFSVVYDRTRDEVLSGPTDSHSEICAIHGIRETSDLAERNIIKLEYTPQNENYADLANYKLHVDEDRTPVWWTTELAERVERKVHQRLLSERILKDGETYDEIRGGDIHLHISGNVIQSNDWIEEVLIPSLRKAQRRGVVVLN